MKVLLKIYSICCFIFIAFLILFSIPFESIPFGGAVSSLFVGSVMAAIPALYIYRLNKREGIEFGWFLAMRNGFWLVSACAVGFGLFLLGLVWLVAPHVIEPALERGSMPVAAMLVIMFWAALIFIFLFLAVFTCAQCVGYIRVKQFKRSAGTFAVAAVCLALAALFCSLFLEVINDIFITLSGTTQNTILLVFVIFAVLSGIVLGSLRNLGDLLPDEDLAGSNSSGSCSWIQPKQPRVKATSTNRTVNIFVDNRIPRDYHKKQ